MILNIIDNIRIPENLIISPVLTRYFPSDLNLMFASQIISWIWDDGNIRRKNLKGVILLNCIHPGEHIFPVAVQVL